MKRVIAVMVLLGTAVAWNAVGAAPNRVCTPGADQAEQFIGITPVRVLDTRTGHPMSGGETINAPVAGAAGLPADIASVAANVTIDEDATAKSYLTIWPAGEERPFTSVNNAQPGIVMANSALLQLGQDGAVSIFNQQGSTNVILDVTGYFMKCGAPTKPAPTTNPPDPSVPPVGGGSSVGAVYGGISLPYEQALSQSDADLNRQADEARNLGVTWVRGDYSWAASEPSRGNYTWTSNDRLILANRARGIRSLPILYFTPVWARPGGTSDKHVPNNLSDYGTWVGQACAHLTTLGVTWVELWNEQNLSGFFQPLTTNTDRDHYVFMAKDATTKCKANAPGMRVLAGGLSTADTVFQLGNGAPAVGNGLYNSMDYYGRAGLYSLVDGIGWHPYLDDYRPGEEAVGWARWSGGAIATALGILDKYAPDRNLQLWNTESAAPRTAVSASEQAIRARLAYESFITGGFAAPYRARLGPYFWFTLRDRGTDSGQRDNTFGLTSFSWVPYPAYAAVKAALARPLG
jgi:hypothetical protein